MQWETILKYLGANIFEIMNTVLIWKFLVKKSSKQILIAIIKKAQKLKAKLQKKLDKLHTKYDKQKEIEKEVEDNGTNFEIR